MVVDTARRWPRRLATAAVLLALVSPVVRDRDGLPLSTYPMYAHSRGTVVSFAGAVGIDERGVIHRLAPTTIASTRDPLVAQSFLTSRVARGEAAELCGEIASRSGAHFDVVEVATELHDVKKLGRGQPSLMERDVHASCPVEP